MALVPTERDRSASATEIDTPRLDHALLGPSIAHLFHFLA